MNYLVLIHPKTSNIRAITIGGNAEVADIGYGFG
jgi:hypothetical protein